MSPFDELREMDRTHRAAVAREIVAMRSPDPADELARSSTSLVDPAAPSTHAEHTTVERSTRPAREPAAALDEVIPDDPALRDDPLGDPSLYSDPVGGGDLDLGVDPVGGP